MHDSAIIAGTLLVFAALLSLANYKQVRARFRERLVPMCLFFGGIALAIALILLFRPKPPPLNSVNGTFENACCDAITLKNGLLITSTQRVPFKLRVEKWGNDAKLASGIRIESGTVVSSSDSGSDTMLFDDEWNAFTVCENRCGPGHEYEFTRRSSEAQSSSSS